MCKTTNGEYCGTRATEIHGMIDGNTLISSANTWSAESGQISDDGMFISIDNMDIADRIRKAVGTKYIDPTTEIVGVFLVGLNTETYKKIIGNTNREAQNDIPSMIISSTVDMRLENLDGYKRCFEEDSGVIGSWEDQINDTIAAVIAKPLRLFPLFSYDPRRYKLLDEDICKANEPFAHIIGSKHSDYEKNSRLWYEPFAHIVGSGDSRVDVKKIWLGFCMNPFLGFRPFDELYYKNLLEFYKKCQKEQIPILTHCAPDGIITHIARDYQWFDRENTGCRNRNGEKRNEIIQGKLEEHNENEFRSNMYQGRRSVVDNDFSLDHFYRNYGHPRNWIPILKYCPSLHLCLAGLGGNREWQHPDMSKWARAGDEKRKNIEFLKREWIRCIIKLTAKYMNVYTDISGLNIGNDTIRDRLKKLLRLVQKGEDDFKHLKYKLIFGSGWYLTESTYGEYCNGFKNLFQEVDGSGELWKRVSLINPWNFYALHKMGRNKFKINEIYNTFVKNTSWNVDRNMLKEMKVKIFGPDPVEWYKDAGIIKYISDINAKRKPIDSHVEFGDDLSEGHIGELITLEELCNITGEKYKSYCKEYIDALNIILPRFGINTPIHLAHFLAQVIHESGRLEAKEENLCYSVQRLLQKHGDLFSVEPGTTKRNPNEYANEPEKLGNYMYANKNGNGDEKSGDGYKYRGRGLMQITGRDAYKRCNEELEKKYGIKLNENIVTNPNAIIANAYVIVASACWFWKDYKKINNDLANENTNAVKKITKKINGGDNGLKERMDFFNIAKRELGIS